MQRYKLEFSTNAKEDIFSASEFYLEKAGINVAERFENDLFHAFKQIKMNPFYQIRKENIRSFPMSNFPFLILFIVYEERKFVRILSVFQTSQSPAKYP